MWDRGSNSTENRGFGLSHTVEEKTGDLHPEESAAKMTQKINSTVLIPQIFVEARNPSAILMIILNSFVTPNIASFVSNSSFLFNHMAMNFIS